MRSFSISASILSSLFVASSAFAQTVPPPPVAPPPAPPSFAAVALAPTPPLPASDTHLDLATLKVLRDRGTITAAEYDSAVRDLNETTGAAVAGNAPTFVLGKFSTTVYGMMKSDFIWDSTQSFGDLAGNTQVQRPGGAPISPPPAAQNTYAGDHPRAQFSIHDTRFGLLMRAPETSGGVRVSGLLEMDLFGQIASNATEQQVYDSSVPRVRHAYFRVETPIVDVLVGQYWHVFGWQNLYHPASVQAQGLAGELYARDMQLRVSKRFESRPITVEIAVAALRPPSRDSAIPQGEAGLRIAINQWTGVMTNGAGGTGVQPLSVAVTGNAREITVPELSLEPKDTVSRGMESIAVDGFIPIIPARNGRQDNALSIHGEFVSGNGISDLYTSLTGGVTYPAVPNTTAINPAPTYPADTDNGLVGFDRLGNLHAINWTSYLFGLQYYLPVGNGRVFIVANYSHMQSANIADFTQDYHGVSANPNALDFTSATNVRKSIDFVDGSLFVDAARGVRIGVEYARYFDHYVDGTLAKDIRVQGAGMFLF
jgi:hypothetical protein